MNTDFSTCTKETLHSLVSRAKNGEIDLNDYWNLGDERYITISKDKIENLEEDLELRCTLLYISKPGVNQKIIVDSKIWHVPEEIRTRVAFLFVKTLREEFGQDKIEYDLMPEYCVNEDKWTSEQNPQQNKQLKYLELRQDCKQ